MKHLGAVILVSVAALGFVAEMGLSYLFVAGLSYLVCLGFHFDWSWTLALGVWAACVLIRWLVITCRKKERRD